MKRIIMLPIIYNKKISCITSIFFTVMIYLTLTCFVAKADILVDDDCETSKLDTTPGWETHGGPITWSTEQYKSGSHSYKFQQRAGVDKRAEVTSLWTTDPTTVNFEINQEYWIGYSIYIPSNFNITNYDPSTIQFHAINTDNGCTLPGSANQPFSVQIYEDGSDLKLNVWQYCESVFDPDTCTDENYNYASPTNEAGTLNKGAWNDIVLHYKPVYSGAGITQVYLNGVLGYSDTTHCNTYNQSKGPYIKLGVYGGLAATEDLILYFDEIKIGDENASYDDVAPGGSPDTTPPVRTSGYPTSTLTSGTTSTTIGLSTNENATCKWDTDGGEAYAAMANTFSTTGAQSHSQGVSGLSDGNTYTYYVRCVDGSTNANIDDYSISFSIDQSGGQTNLLTDSTILDAYYTGTNKSAIYDGCIDNYGPCMAEEDNNDLVFIVDLGTSYNNLSRRFFGDAIVVRVSKLLTIDHKQNWGDSWTNFETDTDVYGNQWYEADLTGITARYLRVTVESDTGYTQFREMEVFGIVTPTPPASISLIPRAGYAAGANVPMAGKR